MSFNKEDLIAPDPDCYIKNKYAVKMKRVGKVLLWAIIFVMIYGAAMLVGGNDVALALAYIAIFTYKGFLFIVLFSIVAAWVGDYEGLQK